MRMRETAPAVGLERMPEGGVRYGAATGTGPVLIVGGELLDWSPRRIHEIDAASLAPVLGAGEPVDLLLVGTGAERTRLPAGVEKELETAAIAVEVMATAPAMRAFNALLADIRVVAAALLPDW